jgi:hypothetical protein
MSIRMLNISSYKRNAIFLLLAFFLLASLLFSVGCGETADTDTTTYYYIWPEDVTVASGETRQFYALSVTDGTVNSVGATFSLSGDVGTITSDGLFTAEAQGAGEIIATYATEVLTASVTVQ